MPVTVLGLARGGVPVAAEVAAALCAPLDVMVVRKLGVPGRDELAMGAVASSGVCVLNPEVISQLQIPRQIIEAVADREVREINRRERVYRANRPPLNMRDCVVILVDDGIATGATIRAAIQAVRKQLPAKLVVAVPVAPHEECTSICRAVDDFISLIRPHLMGSVGTWYADFRPVLDGEVHDLLQRAVTAGTAHAAIAQQIPERT